MPSPATKMIAVFLIFLYAAEANAWGDDGHRVVGSLAMEQTDARARTALKGILGSTSRDKMGTACTWADVVRPTPEWEHTYPWHYINQPRWSDEYDRARDCADGNCLVERIKWAASRLGDDRLDNLKREQAFNFLCHFVGDLHQPLHNTFADDRGGNEVAVVYNGADTDLHTLWDHVFIETFHPAWRKYVDDLEDQMPAVLSGPWSPDLVADWTNESRAYAKDWMYPETKEISRAYEQRALPFIDSQLSLAANRMAWILNSVLGEGQVAPDSAGSD